MITLFYLFLIFFKVGILSFGGGYAIIGMVENEVLGYSTINIDSSVMSNLISIASTTPGPVGINMAAAFGYTVYGVMGAIVSVFAVVLPSLIIVITLALLFNRIEKFTAFNSVLSIVHPTVAAIIIYVACSFAINNNLIVMAGAINFKTIIIMLASIFLLIKKSTNPIILIIIGGICGVAFF